MACIPRDLEIALEAMIDAHGMADVLDGLVGVAGDKADHIRSAWQDEPMARRWEKAMRYLDTCRAKVDEELSYNGPSPKATVRGTVGK